MTGALVADATSWTAADVSDARAWRRPLDAAHLAELDALLYAARGLPSATQASLALPATAFDALRLPATRALLRACAHDLEHGRGFVLLAGFPSERYSYEESRLVLCALLGQLGTIAPQNRERALVIDVIDRDRPYDHTSRGYHSNRLLPFHTDGAHCVALLCLERAHRGGESVIVSAAAASNAVLVERPHLWEVLARGFHHHRRGEQAPGEPALSPDPIPVFSFRNGLLHCMYNRNPIEWAEREGARLTPLQREALDYLDGVLARPELGLTMQLERGDLQILDNFTVLHSRTSYEDLPERRRHLLRVWLDLPDSQRSGATLLDLYVPPERR